MGKVESHKNIVLQTKPLGTIKEQMLNRFIMVTENIFCATISIFLSQIIFF